jgi:hypothetical protein
MNAEIRLDDKEESLASYREYIALETQEKDPARIQVTLLFGFPVFKIQQ